MVFGSAQNTSLKKITEEKLLLRNISALEQTIYEETDSDRKREFTIQLNELRKNLSGLSDNSSQSEEKQTTIAIHTNSKDAELRLARILLERYSETINDVERKTVGEIKALVNRDDLTIQSLASEFRVEPYKFDNHYFQAAEKSYNYLVENIEYIDLDLNISYWLSPKDIVEEKVGDDEDQAVFLCSLLYALGDEKAEVVIAELENNEPHAFVITEFRDKFLLLDPVQGKPFREFYGEKKEIMNSYSFNGEKIKVFLYKFNRDNYEQFND